MEKGGIIDSAAQDAALLSWWHEAGVDCLVDETPRNWLTPPVRIAAAPQASAASPAITPQPPAAPSTALPDTLSAFQTWLAETDSVPIARAQRIAPAGDPASGVMMLVDQPEPDDADAGQLMAGEMGRLFDRMMAAIGRDRASIYLAAVAPGRPVGGTIDDATAGQLARIVRHHVALARPRVLLLLGDRPARIFLGTGFVEARGKAHDIALDGGATRAIATFHPRILLRQPAQKARAWADLQLLMKTLG